MKEEDIEMVSKLREKVNRVLDEPERIALDMLDSVTKAIQFLIKFNNSGY